MRRPSSTLPADVSRDLAALDAALAGEPVAADQIDLAALALSLRDDRPVPGAAFAARLDDSAAAGFAPTSPAGTRPRRSRRTWAGFGILASGAVAAVLVVSLAGGQSGDAPVDRAATPTAPVPSSPSVGAAESVSPTATTIAPSPGAAKAAPPAPDAGATADSATAQTAPSFAAPGSPPPLALSAPVRSVERGASLRLATTASKLDDVAGGVVRATDAVGGFVLSSNVDARPGLGGGATFDLRIPSGRLQSALAQLSRLAHVRSRTQSSLDVTGQVGSAAGRIAGLRAARRTLQRQLAAAPTADDAVALRARLRSVERRLTQARVIRADLRRRVSYSAVAVDVVTERPRAGASSGGGSWTPGDALHDAGRVLITVLGGLLVALAAVLPAALLAAAAWLSARGVRRRRREQVLDGS